MWLIYLVGFVLVFSAIAIGAALFIMRNNRSVLAAIDEVTIRAEVIGDGTGGNRSYQIHDPHHLGWSRMTIDFYTDKEEYIRLNVSHKMYQYLLPGMYGELTYHANDLVRFERLLGHEEARLAQKNEAETDIPFTSDTVYMYCDMPSLHIHIPTDQPKVATKKDVLELASKILDNTADNFLGMDNTKQVIQFVHDGSSSNIIVDIPDMTQNGTHQAILTSIDEVYNIIELYFNGEDVLKQIETEFISF